MKEKDQLIKEGELAYHRRWREKNPDKVKAQRERFYLKKALELIEQNETEDSQNG